MSVAYEISSTCRHDLWRKGCAEGSAPIEVERRAESYLSAIQGLDVSIPGLFNLGTDIVYAMGEVSYLMDIHNLAVKGIH